MKEKWNYWNPIDRVGSGYFISKLCENVDCFEVILSHEGDDKDKIRILFEDSVWAYRSTYEGFRTELMGHLSNKYGSDCLGRIFYEVENSKYVEWVMKESSGITENMNLRHFVIIGLESIVEVIDNDPPTVTLIKQ